MITQSTNNIAMVEVWKNLLKISRRLPVWIYPMAEVLKNLNSFRSTFRTTKLLFDYTQIGKWKFTFRKTNYICYMMWTLGAIMWFWILKPQRPIGTFVTRVTLYDNTKKCDKACSLCTCTPSCTKDQTMYCGTCNRWFLSEKCFQNHLVLKLKGKVVCQWRQVCRNCSF